ncbi:hypothetical protein [Pseudomonas moorei]|uniref:hypothetical protein n=1 Tax=Pseudomonas moorei TaxID=395599 RepID=UPI00200D14DD|nr:hypothetical protein [Pseudomonas moorei]
MQLRGERLKNYLALKLGELAQSYETRSKIYVYSQKEFASFASVSRETVRKYQMDIDGFLQLALISKRSIDRDARVNNLQDKVLRLQADLSEEKAKYEALRIQYVSMLESLLGNSIDVHLLVSRSDESEKFKAVYKQCVLCGAEV